MKRFFTQPHTLFVFFALLFGLVLVFLQPTGAGYDEETHFARVFEISIGHPLPNSYYADNGLPQSFNQVSYRQRKFLTPVDWATIQRNLKYTVRDELHVGYRTRASYSPVNYLPQAAIMAVLGYKLNMPLTVMYYILRITYLLSFTLLGYFAIKVIPFGKWVLFVLMLAPTTVLQFSTVTADAINFGVSFLFIAWSLHLILDKTVMDGKNLFITLLLVALLASVKVNSILLVLLLFLLKRDQFRSTRSVLFFWAAVLVLLVVVAGGWNVLALRATAAFPATAGGPSSLTLVINALKTPLVLVADFFRYFGNKFTDVMTSWIAVYGYEYWTVPSVVFYFFLAALAFAVLHDAGDQKMPRTIRFALLGFFLLMYLGTFALRFIPSHILGGSATIQGRYISTTMPLLFLGLTAWGRPLRLSKWMLLFSISLVVLSMAFFGAGMGLSYYRLCGENSYTGRDCVLPVYKNWATSTDNMAVLPKDGIIRQSIVPDCNNMDQLSVEMLVLNSGHGNEKFEVSLLDPEKDQTIALQEFSMQDLVGDSTIQLNFSPYKNIVNRELFIQIKAISTSDQILGVAVSDPGEYRGSFTLNGEEQNLDIMFHYRCVK